MRFSDRTVPARAVLVALLMAMLVFLVVQVVGQGVERAGLWAGVLGTATAIMDAVVRNWPQVVWWRASEVVLYDSSRSSSPHRDFSSWGGQAWANGTHYGKRATGKLEFHGKKRDLVMSICRTNHDGKLHVSLERYMYRGVKMILPANVTISGKRRLGVICEVKVTGSPHTLWFSWRDARTKSTLTANRDDKGRCPVEKNSWTSFIFNYDVDASKDCYLRIDDYYANGSIPSEVQIRRIVVTEEKSFG